MGSFLIQLHGSVMPWTVLKKSICDITMNPKPVVILGVWLSQRGEHSAGIFLNRLREILKHGVDLSKQDGFQGVKSIAVNGHHNQSVNRRRERRE